MCDLIFFPHIINRSPPPPHPSPLAQSLADQGSTAHRLLRCSLARAHFGSDPTFDKDPLACQLAKASGPQATAAELQQRELEHARAGGFAEARALRMTRLAVARAASGTVADRESHVLHQDCLPRTTRVTAARNLRGGGAPPA